MQIDPSICKMALGCYGYGSWDAPYWFIGPEQGMASDKDIQLRVEAWLGLGENELDDCREFHEHIGEMKWHGKRPKLQKTWKQLMLLLMAFLGAPKDIIGKPKDKTSLCEYQRDHWGRLNDETCVIELSGLPAHCYRTSKKQTHELFEQGQFEVIREKRIASIGKRILLHKPTLVVMYGRKEMAHWEEIAGVAREFPKGVRPSILAFPSHPVSFEGVKNTYWEELGTSLRNNRLAHR